MNYLTIALAALGVAAALGGASVYFKRGYGDSAIKSMEAILTAKNSEIEDLKRKYASLQTQLDIKDRVIDKLSKKR